MMHSSRKAEMSFALIVAIVIGLIILAISAYIIYDKSKQAQAAGKCEALGGKCFVGTCSDPKYPEGSLTPCKPEGEKEFLGRCCYPET